MTGSSIVRKTGEEQYLEMLSDILSYGNLKHDRTGTGTRDLFGYQIRADLQKEFPLLTTKKMFVRGIFEELLWMMRGSTSIQALVDKKVNIWTAWADENGDLGPVYPHQWRRFGSGLTQGSDGVDQLQNALDMLLSNPYSRRNVVTSWNPIDLPRMRLPPCHMFFQFSVRPRDSEDPDSPPTYLDCQMYQRSADAFLGVPFNLASYAALTHIMAKLSGLKPGHFVHTFGSTHIYNNHVDQVVEQLQRDPYKPPQFELLTDVPIGSSVDDFLRACRGAEDLKVLSYTCHSKIRGEVSV